MWGGGLLMKIVFDVHFEFDSVDELDSFKEKLDSIMRK
jgi:hypothetical protein